LKKKYDEAKKYYMMAIEKDNAYAMNHLVHYYHYIEKNYEEAIKYYKINILKIDLSKLTDTGEYEQKEIINGVCQHNITWDRLGNIRKDNPKLFIDNLYNFIHSIISSTFVFTILYLYLYLCNFHLYTFMLYYGYPWFVFSFWLNTVTYLQHHDNDVDSTIVYNDKSWTFVKGALQTVDRSYGYWIDHLSHNITNGHLVHHLFFKQIPHYNLEKATKHLYKYLDKNGIPYKCRDTPDFFVKIFELTYNNLNEAKLIG